MIFKTKGITVTALLLCVCFIAVVSIVKPPQILATSGVASNRRQIILDAGHGGLTNTTH